MEDIEPRFYPYEWPRGPDAMEVGTDNWFCLSFPLLVVAISTMVIDVGPRWWLVAIVALLGVSLRAAARNSWCAGLRLDARGLRACYPLGFGWLYRWDELQDVEIDQMGATVRTRRGDVRLHGNLSDWVHLAGQCRRSLGLPANPDPVPDAAPDLPPAEVARWLGVDIDGTLLCRVDYRWQRGGSILAAALALVVLAHTHVPFVRGELVVLALVFIVGAASFGKGRQMREIRATPRELDVRTGRGWRKYAWGGLHGLEKRGEVWIAKSVDGDIVLLPQLRNREKVLEAIRNAIDARQRGFALPRMSADVPQAALSRAMAGEASAERGLSRAEEEAEG